MTRTRPISEQRVAELFWEKVTFAENGCWLHRGKATYSLVTLPDFTQTGGHRYSYELYRGPIPEGAVLDHLCRNTRCVNPWHLEPVTQRENTRRGVSKVARQMAQTHCIRGHEFTPANTRVDSRGHRGCKECDRLRHLHPDPSERPARIVKRERDLGLVESNEELRDLIGTPDPSEGDSR